MNNEIQKAEARLVEACEDLRRFERRMNLVLYVSLGMFFFGVTGLAILKVLS